MKNTEYSIQEVRHLLESMGQLYDIVRIVDAEECRVLSINDSGCPVYGNECFSVWGASQRCANCSSYQAYLTNTSRNKTERYQGNCFSIQSVPITIRQDSGSIVSCVMEMINIARDPEPSTDISDTVTVDYEYLLNHDEMTHLYNAHALNKHIRMTMEAHPDTTYLILSGSISNFRLINSLFGREKGNELLIGFADVLRRNCSDRSVYGRSHGNHFVICMPKELYSEKRLAAGVQEIRALLDSPHFSLHMHIGVYEVTDLNMPVMVMIDRADIARKTLYRNSERFVAFYTEEMLTRQLREQQVIAEFEQAMTGDQFRILLQPQVNRDGIPSGAEALVRWMLPNGHLIMPGEFVEILERSDLICRMDQRVWELTVRQLAAWKGTCFEQLHLSINVSPKDFYYIDVPAILEKLCMKYGVSPEKLRVEITETALADETCNPAVIVERLHNIGFRVEIDDFGKGYSSLSLLKDICADTLKVDMEFLRHTPNEKRSRIILRSIARMAEDLGMEVIVEGIETEEQVNWLSSNGYQNFQGFYFSRPITSDAFMQNYKSVLESTWTSPT